jgi:chromate transporter
MAGRRTMFVGILGFSALLLIALLTPADSAGAIYAMQYQAGALVFGGGHVVLPLLHDSVVPSGLLSESDFLAGYSAVQAMPGPIFTLSAFLGTASQATHPQWIGGLIALVAIFLPGMLLLAGLIPVWNQLRNKAWAQAGIIGANAAVVGLLAAALVDPVWSHGIQGWADGLIAAIAMVALYRKVPAWLVVFICGGCGYII